jgi:hypothetical protein
MNEPDILGSLSRSPEKWIELRAMQQIALSSLPKTDWCPQVDPPSAKAVEEGERVSLRKQLVAAYKEHAATTIKAIFSYLRDGQWPELQPPNVYYLRQMLARSLMFLQGIVFDRNGEQTTIFPFPGDDSATVFLWFVNVWWLEYGLQETVFEATTDKALFHKYFDL